jgi:dTDP-4-amino-4,6-dideoxygalactose transaminase
MHVRFFNPSVTYKEHKKEFDDAFKRVMSTGELVGPDRKDVLEFEANLAAFTGKKYAVALNSGTDALYLSLKALGIGTGDEVIVSSHTFVASVQVVQQLGATPVQVDLGEDWKGYITDKTKAVIPCHLTGEVLNWEPVPGIPMVDDSCQALGATGLKGVIQCWSFYPAKILGAFGDAGGITTDDEKLARDIKDLGNHWKSDYSKWGINSRMDNLQAALLNVRLKYLGNAIARRKQIAEMYLKGLKKVSLPNNPEGRVWQDFVISTPRRDELHEFLKEKGIGTMKNEYPFPIEKKPNTLKYEAETLRIPCNENLMFKNVNYVIKQINSFYANTV